MSITNDSLKIVPYTSALKHEWYEFVRQSRNGTFLLERDYMEYHSSRFNDYSLLFYTEKRLIALLPGHIQEDSFCSHNGLTYGGLILSNQATTSLPLELFELLLTHLKENCEVEKLLYRPIPSIYHRYPAEEDLYALWRCNAQLTGRKVSSVVEQKKSLPFNTLRKRKLRNAFNAELRVNQDSDFASYWTILNDNLSDRHHATPVHSLEEMLHLHRLFPENIRLFTVRDLNKQIVAGCIIYETERVAHTQYIASTTEGRENGAVDLLFDYLIHTHYISKEFFDLGTSVEEGGRVLNEGLIFQKEGFGGRAVMYDTYEILLNQNK